MTEKIRACTCGECEFCRNIMKQEQDQMRDWHERGLTDWKNY